jgi:hypothetical protein
MAWSKGFWATLCKASSFAKSSISSSIANIFTHDSRATSLSIDKYRRNGAQLLSYVLDVAFRESMCVLSLAVIQFTIFVRPPNVPMNSGTVSRLALRLDRRVCLRK